MPSVRHISQRGLSLIEVTFAVAILAIAITGILMAIFGNAKLIRNNRDYLQASIAAKQKLAEMEGAALSQGHDTQNTDLGEALTNGSLVPVLQAYRNHRFVVRDANNNILFRLASEDLNGNGVLNAGEDRNGNGIIDRDITDVGQVIFPLTGNFLYENLNNPRLGMPMDLDCSGAIENNDDKTTAIAAPRQLKLLPVTIRITWSDGPEVRTYEAHSLLRLRSNTGEK